MFDDKKWLGDQADLAPSVRAGVGVLLARGARSLPADAGRAREAFERAIPAHGIARWDHAPYVLDADKWLEPRIAITIADAFHSVMRQSGLRIRVSRDVWKAEGMLMDVIVADLAKAVGIESVFAEWPGRIPVPLPIVDRGTSRSLIVAGSGDLLREAPDVFGALPQALQQRGAFGTDLYIASSADVPGPMVPTFVAILVGSNASDSLNRFLLSREQHRARCLIHVPVEIASSRSWFAAFLSAWNEREMSINDALKIANGKAGIAARIVASTQSFMLESGQFLRTKDGRLSDATDSVTYSRSRQVSDEPSARDLQFDRALPEAEVSGQTPLEQRPQARVLDARLMHESNLVRRLPTSGRIDIFVDIRPRTELNEDRQVFPDSVVRWEGDSKTFQIHMLELGCKPVTRDIQVPRYGRSESAHFCLEIQNRGIDLRFVVSDGLRILQTARLKGVPDDWAHFEVESIAAPILQQQRQFDVALLVNDSLGGEPSLTSLTRTGIGLSRLSDTEADTARREMLQILETAVVNPNAPTAEVLLRLANLGKLLLEYLQQNVAGWPASMERVQLTTQSDAFFPLEYLYFGPIPENSAHGICPESKGCLSRGEAVPDCCIRAAETHLCPMGFLGLTAVIERQTWRSGSPPGIWLALPQAVEDRQRITNLSQAVFSASDRADDFPDDPQAPGPKPVRTAEVVKALGCNRPMSWKAWKAQVESDKPSLLLLVVHIEEDHVYLGNDERLIIGAISERHVGVGRPIAVAIGCSSGHSKMVGASLPVVLMKRGARVVIAAMTDVLGRHANRAVLDLTLGLRAAVAPSSAGVVSIGELMTKLRRDLLAADIALGLALVAYGDADIALAPDHPQLR